MIRSLLFLHLLVIWITIPLIAQDPLRFKDEVRVLLEKTEEQDGRSIVFTGSSSIRLWHHLDSVYSGFPVINLGFGGSQMSDLLFFVDELVLNFEPCQVFVYEGDNDLNSGKSPEAVMNETRKLVSQIHSRYPTTEIIFISPKPSVARWDKRTIYLDFNQRLASYAASTEGVHFADVWTPALNPDGSVKNDIFLGDQLHMNRKGYLIWEKVLRPFLKICPD